MFAHMARLSGVVPMITLVLGPCIECQDRYGFPIMYSMPLVLACLGFLLRQKQAMRAKE